MVTDDTDRGIRAYTWARDGRHLLYVQDTGGDENWRLYDVDLETMDRRDLTPFEGIQARIIATRKSHRDEVLVGINRDNPQLHDVYRLDLTTGELVKEIENPGYAGWLADEDMVVRGAIAPLPDGGVRHAGPGRRGRRLADAADASRPTTRRPATRWRSPATGSRWWPSARSASNTGRLTRIDLATGEAEVVLEDPEADVTGALLHPDTREPQIVVVAQGPGRVPRARPGGGGRPARRSGRCTPVTRASPGATRPTRPG